LRIEVRKAAQENHSCRFNSTPKIELSVTIRGRRGAAHYGRMKILIADDSALARGHLVELLSEMEQVLGVATADDVPSAIKALREHQPDVLILDLQMPGGSGFDVLAAIREQQLACRVVVLTGHDGPAYREKAAALGAHFFLGKSAEFDRLPKVLAELSRPADHQDGPI
jgi:DNA-binding NarL/FixJ family response regulator